MEKTSKPPRLSLVANPMTQQAAQPSEPGTCQPRPIRRTLRSQMLQEAAFLRGLGRRIDGEDERIRQGRRAEARIDAFYNAANVEPLIARIGMILDQPFREIYIFDKTTLRFIYANAGGRRNLQYSLEELHQLTISDIHPEYNTEYSAKDYAGLLAPLRSGEKTLVVLKTLHRRKDGSLYPVEAHIQFCQIESSPVFICSVNDITEREQAEPLLRAKELAEFSLECIGDAVITVDAQGKIIFLNQMAAQLTGWSYAEAKGLSLATVFFIINDKTRKIAEIPFEKVLRNGDATRLPDQTVLRTRGGREYAISAAVAPVRARGGAAAVVLVFYDDTAARRRLRHLAYQASHDALTKLVNRRTFEREAEFLLDNARMTHKNHTLLFVNIDKLQAVNDHCGPLVGNQLLRRIVNAIVGSVRESDTVARLEYGVFAVLLEGCPVDQAQRSARALTKAIKNLRLNAQQRLFTTSISVGVVSITAHSADLQSLLGAADTACRQAKRKRGNRLHAVELTDPKALDRQREELISGAHKLMNTNPHEPV